MLSVRNLSGCKAKKCDLSQRLPDLQELRKIHWHTGGFSVLQIVFGVEQYAVGDAQCVIKFIISL